MTTHPWSIPDHIEAERMRDVERLELLDTPGEERFDQVVRMARRVFGVPMASLSLMDHDRQWFKSIDGIDLTELPRENTVCRVTIAQSYHRTDDPVLILPDAAADPVFAEIPGIGGPGGVRFYAGYPLYGPVGHPVGVFCIYDTVPRQLSADQIEAFTEIARWAQRELEHSDAIARAAEVQNQLLPRPLAGLPGYEIATVCLPAFMVGGDFYDHYQLGDSLVVTVADVMGKGLGAAIVSSAVRASLRGASRVLARYGPQGSALDTAEVTALAAEHLAEDTDHTGTFVTALIAAIDVPTGDITYTDAGHGLAMIRRADGTIDAFDDGGPPIGILPDSTWPAGTARLDAGDVLVICSDGLLDLIDQHSDRTALWEFVAAYSSPGALIGATRALVAGRPPLDDVTVVAVRRDAP